MFVENASDDLSRCDLGTFLFLQMIQATHNEDAQGLTKKQPLTYICKRL